MGNKLLNIIEFSNLSQQERKEYVLEKNLLKDLWVIGKIKGLNPQEKSFFFIDFFLNPYTGHSFINEMFDRPPKNTKTIYCAIRNEHKIFKDDATVLVNFKINPNPEALARGNIFSTTIKNVHPINIDAEEEILNLINLTKEELSITALVVPSLYNSINILDFQQAVKNYIENEKKTLKIEMEKIDIVKSAIQDKENSLKIQQEELLSSKQELSAIKNKLSLLGFELDSADKHSDDDASISYRAVPPSIDEFIQNLQEKLKDKRLNYEKDTLRRILLGLKTEQMIILSGPSGTGKTTIVKELFEIINAEVEVIPVQPSWTDKQDLFGYYNPIRKLYVPSPFLDCLIDANNNPNKLYVICLDEINLAQIEYYLADFLSLKEIKSSQFRLYSDFEYQQNLREVQWLVQNRMASSENSDDEKSNLNSLSDFETVIRSDNLSRYPATIPVPTNVRIIGTMNVEGLVQPLSPKVTDRSFVIPMYRQQDDSSISVNPDEKNFSVKPSYFLLDSLVPLPEKAFIILEDIQNTLQRLNIEYNSRFDNHVKKYFSADLNLNKDVTQLVDDIVLLKVLPRIHEVITDPDIIDSIEEVVRKHLGDESHSHQKLERMKRRFEQTSLYSYWS